MSFQSNDANISIMRTFCKTKKRLAKRTHCGIIASLFGALAKLGSRLTGSQEARGSNPLCST